jgi:phosphatidate cytidylyltransferase
MRALRAFAPPGEGHFDPRNPRAASPTTLRGRWTDLAPRVASAIVMIALALVTLAEGGGLFAVFWFAASLAIHWEWQRMVGGERPLLRFLLGAVVLAAAAYLMLAASFDAAVFVIFAGAVAMAWAAGPGKRLWSAGGLVYAGALVASVCLLRFSVFDGLEAVLWLFAVVWGTDVMAYFGGRVIGGRKLVPRVSPSKTWSGLLSGLICGTLIGLGILDLAAPFAKAAVLPILLLGLVVSAVSQCGDLFESTVKRHFGVKDTGRLIPGHGGVMDRLDGFTAASTFAALFGLARAGTAAAAHGLFHW